MKTTRNNTKPYDVVVIGGGHAGIEACVAAARLGCKTLLLSQDVQSIGRLSCNPSIGGSAKGHLVKEIDALGGQMPFIADRSGLQFKMLNRSKGPAIWSPRSQNDKFLYPLYAQHLLLSTENLDILADTAVEIEIENDTIVGIITKSNEQIACAAIILCSGTFLNGVLHTGTQNTSGGRYGENATTSISDLLSAYGLERGRLKTGTPPRVYSQSIDYSKTEITSGDSPAEPFSHRSREVRNTLCCYMSHTGTETHRILQEGFNDSPMYSGRIKGAGPRYCPSIEDKISRFAERESHQIVLEPESLFGDTVYINGFSTSLSKEIQERALHTIPGLEHCVVQRWGYAVEYDFFFPYQLKHTLESKSIAGLFFAGQINGTSGYEEAASQGLVAGINAAHRVLGRERFTLSRSESYIGVMIDDLVNKNTEEPYRIFTSLAEYRLLLRQDNADERLMTKGYEIGLINSTDYEKYTVNNSSKKNLRDYCDQTRVPVPANLSSSSENTYNILTLDQSTSYEHRSITDLAKRPEFELEALLDYAAEGQSAKYTDNVIRKVSFDIKYEGYIKRMERDIQSSMKSERKPIPDDFNYAAVKSLSTEARQKLQRIRPETIGQASRISGISATDISILTLYLTKS